ncbi:MAG: nucleoside monophosphate kinase [Chlamydiia bacterium]|nr:nucleoside monophosphate kinase [Chlamydiia bacterium]
MTHFKRFSSILLFGPPGSGKGTLGEQLASKKGHLHLSSGDIFRGLDPESKIGKIFKSYGEQGKLVPDEVTIEIFEQHMLKMVRKGLYNPKTQLLMLDGIPRTKRQAEVLERDIEVKRIILLDVPDVQILIDRIQGRAQEQGRHDDQSESVLRQRFEVYEQQTREVLSHYPQDLVFHIDGNQSKQAVFDSAFKALESII